MFVGPRWPSFVCVLALLHLLSLSSQEKAEWQRGIKACEVVSDECSSGVMRVVHVAHLYLVCVLCVQLIAGGQSEIEDPNTREEEREVLKYSIQLWENNIQHYKLYLSTCETEIKQIETENKGESII